MKIQIKILKTIGLAKEGTGERAHHGGRGVKPLETIKTMKKPMPICLSLGYWYDQNKEKIVIFGAIELDEQGKPIKGTEGSEQEILKKCVKDIHFRDA